MLQRVSWFIIDDGTNVFLPWVSRDTPDWVHQPPHADGGGAVIDSEPRFGVLEFYATPFESPDLG